MENPIEMTTGDLDPDKVYPRDTGGGVHSEGLIIGSTFYDLYTSLRDVHGDDQAIHLLSGYALKSVFTASRYTDVYNAILVVDDDNGDLSDQTPNYCVINKVFAQHGLATADEGCELASVDTVEVDDRSSGNGNLILEPGETADLWMVARNAAAQDLADLTGKVSVTGAAGVTVTQPDMAWDSIPARSTRRSSQAAELTIGDNVACGTPLTLTVNLASASRTAVITQALTIGRLAGTAETIQAGGLPLPVRDNTTVSASLPVNSGQWAANTLVDRAQLRFDITHPYVGDLSVTLTAPDGTVKDIWRGSGSADDVHFDQDVTDIVKGLKGKGEWKLNVKDSASQDEGTLVAASLVLTPARYECQ